MVHQRPLVGVWDGLLVHHLSVYLPFCGHLQFAKSHSAQGVKSSYVEGTHDQREVRIFCSINCCVLHLNQTSCVKVYINFTYLLFRKVNGVALPLKRSQILSQWGLSDVLTTMSDEERQNQG